MVSYTPTNMVVLLLTITISHQVFGRDVGYIEINKTGAFDGSKHKENGEEQCKPFKPTKKQLIDYFKNAKESKEDGGLYHEYYSPCLATGTVKFKDGSSGQWLFLSSGYGHVSFTNEDKSYFFFKDNKWTDPYACNYGLGDEPKC